MRSLKSFKVTKEANGYLLDFFGVCEREVFKFDEKDKLVKRIKEYLEETEDV